MANDANGTPQMSDDDNDFVVRNNFNINHDPDDLIRYRGNWVAWSRDGRKVLFAHPDPEKLCELVDAAGLKPGDYVLSGLPSGDCIPEFGWRVLD